MEAEGPAAAAELLLAACREYKSGVSGLLNALEGDVYRAAERCWRLQDRSVQLRGGLIRSKTVVLQEATFQPEVEQNELGGALDQWRDAVKSVAVAAALQIGVAEQQLVAAVGRALTQDPPAPAEQLLGLLSMLLGAHDTLLALNQRELRRTLGLLGQLCVQVATAWRQAGGTNPNDLLAAHSTAPQEVIATLTAPPAVAAEGAAADGGQAVPQAVLPPEQAASMAKLQARQAEVLEELADAAEVLRFWGRRSEKAAAGSPAAGREGDVPPMMAQAQQLLWSACQAYEEEQAAADLRSRQLACQRYRPADLPALQQRADEFAGGERVPAQQNLMYEPEFVELRGQARALAARFVQEDALAQAAQQLHQLRYLLLDADLPPESAAARQQLLVRVAESLLDGSTPPAAAPLLVAMLQEGLRRAEEQGAAGGQGAEAQAPLSDQERARLVPMVCRALVTPRGSSRSVLRREEGAALLRSLLRPEGMLDEGRLGRCASALEMIVHTCAAADVPAKSAEALLSLFDASRLAVLVCERASELGSGGEGEAGGGGVGGGDGDASVDQLLCVAHTALGQPGAEPTGVAILEGILLLQPASYFAAALQLALTSGSGGQTQQRVISMLCRVPADMLPPAVVGDALVQLAEALDGATLAPPFLPHDLMGRLYRTPCVLRSMQLTTERGPEAAAAAAAADAGSAAAGGTLASGQRLWTVRIGAGHIGEGSSAAGSGAEQAASGSSAADASGGAAAAEGTDQQAGAPSGQEQPGVAAAGGRQRLLLLPLQASPEPLAVLLQRLVGAVLSCLLRRAGGAIDATTVSEELSALLEALMLPAAEQGAWMLQWLWQTLYLESLRDFLRDLAPVDQASSQLACGAFQSYWASLPWQLSSFHAASPTALAALRLHLVSSAGDGAAAILLGRLDFTPVLAKAVPPAQLTPRQEGDVYRLGDEEDEEEQVDYGPGGSSAWAAELGLLALHACVLLPPPDQPAWLQQLLLGPPAEQQAQAMGQQRQGSGGEEEAHVPALLRSALSATLAPLAAAAGEQQPLLPALLAGADWRRLAAVMHAEEATAGGSAPWLLLPALLALAETGGDLGGRVVRAASLLSRAAILAGSTQAVRVAAGAAAPLLLCTLCQGTKHQPQQRRQRAQAAAAVAVEPAAAGSALQEQQERVVIPDDFPRELLEGTVEGQQLLLLQQQDEEQRQLEAERQAAIAAAAAEAAAEAEEAGGQQGQGAQEGQQEGRQQQQQGQQQEIVEVRACWSLTAGQHVALLEEALLPLAASCATAEAAASWQLEQCPPELAAAGGSVSVVSEWRSPHLAELAQAASLAATAGEPAAAGGGAVSSIAGTGPASGADQADQAAAAAASVAAVLLPLVRPPATLLLSQDSLAFANSDLPLDTEGAVYVSVAAEAGGRGSGADAHVVRLQLLQAMQAACKQAGNKPLTACLLRMLYVCPALHASTTGALLSESLLRFMAAPEQDGGPLGQGAAAAAGGTGTEDAPGTVSGGAGSSSMLPATTATQGLPATTLLGLAQHAAQLQAPLTAALAMERLRQVSTVLPKDEWQAQTTQVLRVALQAEAPPAHPYDVVAVWLAALPWVADARWRRLASGPHQEALLGWLESLELRVVALQLAQPEDFSLESSGSTARRLLSGAADRFKAMRQHIPGLAPSPTSGESPADAAEPPRGTSAGQHPPGLEPGTGEVSPASAGGRKEPQLGQRLSTGFRSLLGKTGGQPVGSGAAIGEPEAQGEHADRRKWGDKMRNKLSKIGLGGSKGERAQQQQQQQQHIYMAEEGEWAAGPGVAPAPAPGALPGATPQLPVSGHSYAGPALGTVVEEGGSFTSDVGGSAAPPASHVAPDAGHLGLGSSTAAAAVGPAASPGGGPTGSGAVRQKLSSGLQAVGRGLSGGLSKVKEKVKDLSEHQQHPQGMHPDELAEHDRDVASRIGLAAFAVSAYIKSVLCPSLTPRLDSAGPATPTAAGAPRPGEGFAASAGGPLSAAQHHFRTHHRTRSSFGSMQLDAEYMRELDRVLEARSELDTLDTLAACPLLAAHPGRYQTFLTEAPQLLSAATTVEAFQRWLQQLLFPGQRQLVALA